MPLVIVCCAIAIVSTADLRAFAQFGGGRGVEERAEDAQSDEPRRMIALSLWALTLSEPEDAPVDESNADRTDLAENLPPDLDSVRQVRELVDRLRNAGLLRSVREFRMVTLAGQPVTARSGRNQPRIVAVASDSRRGRTNALQMEPIGTVIEAVPQVDSGDYVQVSLKFTESNIEKSADVLIAEGADGSPLFADVVTTREFNTTARLKSGGAIVLHRDTSIDSDEPLVDKTELIILGAGFVDPTE